MPYYQCMVLQIKNILHKMNNSIFGDNILMLKEYQITIELCFKLHTNMYSTNDFHSYQSLKHCKITVFQTGHSNNAMKHSYEINRQHFITQVRILYIYMHVQVQRNCMTLIIIHCKSLKNCKISNLESKI